MPLLQVLFMPYQVLVDLMPSGPPRDATNASIALMLSKSNLLVRILVELNSAGKCVLLCSSSEGMGNRAPVTTALKSSCQNSRLAIAQTLMARSKSRAAALKSSR